MTCPRQREFEEEQVALLQAAGRHLFITVFIIAALAVGLLALYLEVGL